MLWNWKVRSTDRHDIKLERQWHINAVHFVIENAILSGQVHELYINKNEVQTGVEMNLVIVLLEYSSTDMEK